MYCWKMSFCFNHYLNVQGPRFYDSPFSFDKKYYAHLNELDIQKPLPRATLITAISESHAEQARAQVYRFLKEHPDWKIYIYDIGLFQKTKAWFMKACNVEFRKIDIERYNVHTDLLTYRWKPIVIAEALKEFPIVFWIGTSTFAHPNVTIDGFISKIKIDEEGPHVYLVGNTSHSTFAVTSPGMYYYLRPEGSVFDVQFAANKAIFIRTKSTYEKVLKWLVLCALEEKCMAPDDHQRFCEFHVKDRFYTKMNCHRYDQSALNIIVSHYPKCFLGYWAHELFWSIRDVRSQEEDLSLICKNYSKLD